MSWPVVILAVAAVLIASLLFGLAVARVIAGAKLADDARDEHADWLGAAGAGSVSSIHVAER